MLFVARLYHEKLLLARFEAYPELSRRECKCVSLLSKQRKLSLSSTSNPVEELQKIAWFEKILCTLSFWKNSLKVFKSNEYISLQQICMIGPTIAFKGSRKFSKPWKYYTSCHLTINVKRDGSFRAQKSSWQGKSICKVALFLLHWSLLLEMRDRAHSTNHVNT